MGLVGLSAEIAGKVIGLKISKLNEAVEQCTSSQQALYGKLFPNGPTDEQLPTAIRLVERTLQKNAEEKD